ncbi:GntP family permease [Rhodococcus indonesiensis]|uniref:GntP family permease n=1 Tax=Rhodococcus indonesiensis TaxID=3055869 RepID=UPI0039F64B4F
MILSLLGIVLSLVFLITLAYRGHSVLYVAPLAALIAILFSGLPALGSYTQIFMPAMGGFIISYFPLFLTGAIFGSLMSLSGSAQAIAQWLARVMGPRRAIFITVLATALLTYGGVSGWVVVFSVFPIATALFREADIPRRLLPAAIMLGLFTFSLAAIPGSPQIHNTMPGKYFGTNTFAAPVLSLLATALVFGVGMAWLTYRQNKLKTAGESYFDPTEIEKRDDIAPPTLADGPSSPGGHALPDFQEGLGESATTSTGGREAAAAPATRGATAVITAPERPTPLDDGVHRRGAIGLLPVVVVASMNALATYLIIPGLDTSYLAEEAYGSTSVESLLSIWSVIIALVSGVVWLLAWNFRQAKDLVKGLSEGAQRAVAPCMITASEVGYGAIIASLAAFAVVRDGLFTISENPLVTGVLSVTGISGITGSASGGLAISLETFGADLATAAAEQGIDMEVMHRVIAMASTSFDSLPHNGAMITVLVVCGLTHREAYKDIFVVSVLVPLVGVLFAATLGLTFGAF